MGPGSSILVSFIEKQSEGMRFQRRRNSWPLHITLVPWFRVDNEQGLEAALSKVANATLPFTLRIGQELLFGANADVPVNIIADQAKVVELHKALWSAVTAEGADVVSRRWIGESFRAHITQHDSKGGNLTPGEAVAVDSLNIVHLQEGDVCQIGKQFRLQGDS